MEGATEYSYEGIFFSVPFSSSRDQTNPPVEKVFMKFTKKKCLNQGIPDRRSFGRENR